MGKPNVVGMVATSVLVAVVIAACGSGGDSGSSAVDQPAAATEPPSLASPKRPSDAPAWVEVTGAPMGQSKGAHRLDSDSGVDLTPGLASFKPAAPGAAVTVERKTDSGWEKVASGQQSARGKFAFFAAAGTPEDPATFRTSTVPGPGKEPIVSEENAARPLAMSWSDEFSGTELGPDWLFQQGGSATRLCATGHEPNTTIGGGTANFTVTEDKSKKPDSTCRFGYFHNGRISTAGVKTFKYGTFAARIKFNDAQGAHGSFWLQHPPPAADVAPGDAATTGAEIDVVEYFGAGLKNGLQHSSWYPTRGSDGAVTMKQGIKKMTATETLADGHEASDGYHVYSVEWTPTAYIFRIDGVETYRMTEGISRVPQFMILSLLSSDWELPRIKTEELPTTMKVDWVRLWK